MKLNMCVALVILTALGSVRGWSQPPPPTLVLHTLPEVADNRDDPGYKLYKEGYNLILGEQWEKARQVFTDLISKHKDSEYVDDAAYWSAYALKYLDRKKAKDAYKRFVNDYTGSSYYDDAVADMIQLDRVFIMNASKGAAVSVYATPDSHAYSYSYGPFKRQLDRMIRRQTKALTRVHAIGTTTPFALLKPEKLDKETELRMEALYALGETREDQTSFQTLKEVATDIAQPYPLREAALDALSNFRKFEVLPVFVDIARKDTSKRLQTFAIDYITEVSKDKNKSVEVLIDLFNTLPKNREEQTATIFYSIAEVGNEKAVDFLTEVALTHDNYDLRTDAVYYLGNIGGDKARNALYRILKGK